MPAGVKFTIRANKGSNLVFLVMVLPRWQPELFHTLSGGPWGKRRLDDASVNPRERAGGGLETRGANPRAHYDYLAPDGSEIRMLADFAKGGLAQCTLPPGAFSTPVHHKTVHEIWYVTEGHGGAVAAIRGWRGERDCPVAGHRGGYSVGHCLPVPYDWHGAAGDGPADDAPVAWGT